jgi:hypothetical protein
MYFHLVCHPYIFFGEVSVQLFCPYFNLGSFVSVIMVGFLFIWFFCLFVFGGTEWGLNSGIHIG